VALIEEAATPIAIDEIQRAPDLLLAIKRRVDRDARPGQFLLTGSANILTAPRVLEALTGRTDIVTLWPLSASEIAAGRDTPTSGSALAYRNLVDRLFAGEIPRIRGATIGREAWVERALAGGFPEALGRPPGRPRAEWFDALLTSLTTRDLRDISGARRLADVPRLVRALAGNVGSPLVTARLSQKSGMPASTIDNYLQLLETTYVIRTLPAWRPGVANRERRAPKVVFADSGVLGHLLEADRERVESDSHTAGALFESFTVMELIKQCEWADRSASALHFRREGGEIDLILEARSGEFVAVEAKAAASLGRADLRALSGLREARPELFRAGIVLYAGESTVPLGDRLWAVPVSALWQA
jgi:hypothetical protein